MRKLLLLILFSAAACAAQQPKAGPLRLNPPDKNSAADSPQTAQIQIPAGTTVPLALTRALWMKTAGAGDAVYAETVFPVAVNNQIAIPAGTYAEGQIDSLTRPGIFSPHAQLQIHFTKLVFANGYTVIFSNQPAQDITALAPAADNTRRNDVLPAVSAPYVQVSAASDILLDNGAQIEMVLQTPLRIDAPMALNAASHSNPALAAFKTASLCRPTPGTPGTPGTPDTVIPGSPGTPDTVIPGAPGQPDIVIPGAPATPDTVIPGTPGMPGTPGTACPGPPVVSSSPKQFKGDFQLDAPALLYGQTLAPGKYQLSWTGLEPVVTFEIMQKGRGVLRASAHLLLLARNSPANDARTNKRADGTQTLQSLQFVGQNCELDFDLQPN